jgi:TatA/E family protein of Tat protein translocase
MALDDPIVLALILAAAVFLFGSSKIPQFARALGQARKEFDNGWKGVTSEITSPTAGSTSPLQVSQGDPLLIAAQNEGIDTRGKTREQIASELSWKLNGN